MTAHQREELCAALSDELCATGLNSSDEPDERGLMLERLIDIRWHQSEDGQATSDPLVLAPYRAPHKAHRSEGVGVWLPLGRTPFLFPGAARQRSPSAAPGGRGQSIFIDPINGKPRNDIKYQ